MDRITSLIMLNITWATKKDLESKLKDDDCWWRSLTISDARPKICK